MMTTGGHGHGTAGEVALKMYRDIAGGTSDVVVRHHDRYGYRGSETVGNFWFPFTIHALDSPSTTSACTYHFSLKGEGAGTNMEINYNNTTDVGGGTVVAFEIDGS